MVSERALLVYRRALYILYITVNGNPIQYQEQKQAGKAGVGKLRPVSISYLTSISS
jgi:hypothetical protein